MTTLDLLRQIKEKNYPVATKTFNELMTQKREAAENISFKNFAANLFASRTN